MVSATPARMRANHPAAILTFEAFVVLNHVLSDVHMIWLTCYHLSFRPEQGGV